MSKLFCSPKVFLSFLLAALALKGNAQRPRTMNKPHAGVYTQGSTSAVYIFDEGEFAFIGYATFLRGTYILKGKTIHLKVDVPVDDFVMLGREEPGLRGKTKLTFNSSFAGVSALIQFDEAPERLVFDKTTNYVRPYYPMVINQRPAKFALTLANPQKPNAPNTIVFNPPAAFNDFLILYKEPLAKEESFNGVFEKVDGKTALYLGGTLLEKDRSDTGTLNFVKETLEAQDQHRADSLFYFNDQLKSITGHNYLSEGPSTFSRDNYILDIASNKFIDKEIYTAGRNYTDSVASDYHDETYILEYQAVRPQEKKRMPLSDQNGRAKPLMKAERAH